MERRHGGHSAVHGDEEVERLITWTDLNAPYYPGNFNQPNPFPDCPRQHYSAAILGEVFEHILYHPVGFLQQIGALLTPGGILILTTPNPYTLANAVRMLRGEAGTIVTSAQREYFSRDAKKWTRSMCPSA